MILDVVHAQKNDFFFCVSTQNAFVHQLRKLLSNTTPLIHVFIIDTRLFLWCEMAMSVYPHESALGSELFFD